MIKMHLQKLSFAAIVLFLMVSCSKEDTANTPAGAIGTQLWDTKNLDVDTYRDGTPIPQVTDAASMRNLTTGAWCYNMNDPANGVIYGKLYNWYAVVGIHDNDPNTPNKELAPEGWHVPSDAEWTTLTTFLGGEDVAGGKMKSTGTTLWKTPNADATNSSGFNCLPAGYYDGYFVSYIGEKTYLWSSSEKDTNMAWNRFLDYNGGYAPRNFSKKKVFFQCAA